MRVRKTGISTPSSHQESGAPRRDRHGDRGVPSPLAFDIYALPDSTLLTLRDVAAHTRNAVATVQKWRGRPDHPLKWIELPGGFVRTTVGDLKRFLAGGQPRPSLTPPTAQAPSARKISKRKPKARADLRDAAPINRRRANHPSARCREKERAPRRTPVTPSFKQETDNERKIREQEIGRGDAGRADQAWI